MKNHAFFAYGSPEIGISGMEFMIQIYLLNFYVSQVGLSAKTVGALMAVAVLWDALTDPLMGWFSDVAKAKGYSRKGFVLWGGLALSLSFCLLFNPPNQPSPVFFLAAYLMVNTSMTVLIIPHFAMAGDLQSQEGVRTKMFGIRFLFTNLGLLIGLALPAFLQSSENTPVGKTSLVLAPVLALACLWCYKKAPDVPVELRSPKKKTNLLRPLQDRPFQFLLGAQILGTAGRTLNGAFALFYYQLFLRFDRSQIGIVLICFTFAMMVSIPLWLNLAQKWGKLTLALAGLLGLSTYTFAVYPFFPPEKLFWPSLGAVFGGILAGSIFLLDAVVSQMADQSGQKESQGLYFGYWKFAGKASRALGLMAAGFLWDMLNDPNRALTDVPYATALVFGPCVALFFFMAAIILWRLDRSSP